jgi:EspG family
VLTTTVDGLWVLQVLTGIEALAPELGLAPMALSHPIAAELRREGVIDEAGTVDAAVVEWLTVLARRDVALVIRACTPDDAATPAGALLARFAKWWVLMERSEELVRISGAGTASAEGAANVLLTGQIERLCGTNTPAPLRPITLDADALLVGVRSQQTLCNFLMEQRVEPDQLRILTTAADPQRSAQTSIVAMQSGVETGEPMRTHIERSVVTIIDAPEGRLLAEHFSSDGKRWTVIGPGTVSSIGAAVNRMLRRLPANEEWYSYRKVV